MAPVLVPKIRSSLVERTLQAASPRLPGVRPSVEALRPAAVQAQYAAEIVLRVIAAQGHRSVADRLRFL